MPSVTLPMIGMPNRRGFQTVTTTLTKDQRYIGIMHTFVENAAANSRTVYAEKRPGFFASELVAGAGAGKFVFHPYISNFGAGSVLGSFYQWGSNIYEGTTFAGLLDGTNPQVMYCMEAAFSSVAFFMFTVVDNSTNTTAYFLAADARTTTFTGDFTSGNATVSNVSSFTGLYVGMKLSTVGAQVASGARIASLNSGGGSLVMTIVAGANGTGTTVTNEMIAKIIDADFPTAIVGSFVAVNGRAYIQSRTGGIYGSDLNNPASWSASNLVEANYEPDEGAGLALMRQNIIALGTNSIQFFYDAGNTAGSQLSPARHLIRSIGSSHSPTFHQYCRWRDDIYFVGHRFEGIHRLREGEVSRVSDLTVDGLLAANPPVSIQPFTYAGRDYLLLQMAGSGGHTGSMLYDIRREFWVESGFPLFFHMSKRPDVPNVSPNGTSGNTYSFVLTDFLDAGAPYTATMQLSPVDLGNGKAIKLTSAELLADTQSAGTATFEISTNDFGSFTTVGAFDMTADRKIVNRGGYSRSGRVIPRITHSHNSAFRAWGLRLNYEVGGH